MKEFFIRYLLIYSSTGNISGGAVIQSCSALGATQELVKQHKERHKDSVSFICVEIIDIKQI